MFSLRCLLPPLLQLGTVKIDPLMAEYRRLLERAGVGNGKQAKIDECELELRHKSFASDYRKSTFTGKHAPHYVAVEDVVMILGKHLLQQHDRNHKLVEQLFEKFDTDHSDRLELPEFKKVMVSGLLIDSIDSLDQSWGVGY